MILFSVNAFSQKCTSDKFVIREKRKKRILSRTNVCIKSKYFIAEEEIIDTLTQPQITGVIYSRLTREPLQGVGVYTERGKGVVSDSIGKFCLSLNKGRYKIKFQNIGVSTFSTKWIKLKYNTRIQLVVFLGVDYTQD